METIVVIGIILVLGGVSWAGLVKYQPSLALSAAARNLTADLRLVQQLSITEQVNHGIFFDISNSGYQLEKIGATIIVLAEKNLPANIVFCGITGLLDDRADFNPYGSALYSGSVCLSNSNGQTKIVDIKPSGFVKIQN